MLNDEINDAVRHDFMLSSKRVPFKSKGTSVKNRLRAGANADER